MTLLAPTLQAFFTTRLIGQVGASPHTIAAYRDTWRLLLRYVVATTGTPAHTIDSAQLDADLIGAFLNHLQDQRGNSIATRNARLAAVHSLFTYAAIQHLNTPHRSREYWPSRPSGASAAPTSPT